MELKLGDFISFSAFILAVLVQVKAKKRTIKVFAWIVSIAAIGAAIFLTHFPKELAGQNQAVSTKGDNASATAQSANGITDSTVIQAAPGSTVSPNIPNYNISGGNNQIGGTGNVQNIFQDDQMPADTRLAIRQVLNSANPEFVQLIDSGTPAIPVMLRTVTYEKLEILSTRVDFGKFLSIENTQGIMIGQGSRIGDSINELNQSGVLNSYILHPTSSLRNAAPMQTQFNINGGINQIGSGNVQNIYETATNGDNTIRSISARLTWQYTGLPLEFSAQILNRYSCLVLSNTVSATSNIVFYVRTYSGVTNGSNCQVTCDGYIDPPDFPLGQNVNILTNYTALDFPVLLDLGVQKPPNFFTLNSLDYNVLANGVSAIHNHINLNVNLNPTMSHQRVKYVP